MERIKREDISERLKSAIGKTTATVISEWVGATPTAIAGWKKSVIPSGDLVANFCQNAQVSANWLLLDKGPKSLEDCDFSPKNKVVHLDQTHNVMHQLEGWIATLNNGDRDEVVNFIRKAVRENYEGFGEWLKKRAERGDCGTTPESKSAV